MAADAYANWLDAELGGLIDGLDLDERQKRYVRSRWLDQVLWLERKAKQNQQRYYLLRLVTIIGGVIVPALVSLNVRKGNVAASIAWTTFALSLVVAVSAAVEEFFHYGDRWRNFRRSVELLKGRGWHFLQLAGPYAAYATHAQAFRLFAADVEALIGQEVEAYVTQIVRERKEEAEPEPARAGGS